MLGTYKAILKGNRLEWSGDSPDYIVNDHAIGVLVTILEEAHVSPKNKKPGQRMAAALEKLAAIQALADLPEPDRWEREIRQDRPLPDRAL